MSTPIPRQSYYHNRVSGTCLPRRQRVAVREMMPRPKGRTFLCSQAGGLGSPQGLGPLVSLRQSLVKARENTPQVTQTCMLW